jgi:hypothetical protein
MGHRSAATIGAILAVAGVMAVRSAAALNGEVLIDQQAAKAGGITPKDDPGFPITISRSGKYKLTGNLRVGPGKSGFRVTADWVTLDLNGFTVSGGRTGINAPTAEGLTVMNGTLAGFASDAILAGGFAIVEDMQIAGNGGNGVTLDNNGRVLRSTISGNASGVFCFRTCLIAHNVITGGKVDGLTLPAADGGHLVLDNIITDNTKFGIYDQGPTGFGDNTLTGNNGGGAQVLGDNLHPVHPNYCDPACP